MRFAKFGANERQQWYEREEDAVETLLATACAQPLQPQAGLEMRNLFFDGHVGGEQLDEHISIQPLVFAELGSHPINQYIFFCA